MLKILDIGLPSNEKGSKSMWPNFSVSLILFSVFTTLLKINLYFFYVNYEIYILIVLASKWSCIFCWAETCIPIVIQLFVVEFLLAFLRGNAASNFSLSLPETVIPFVSHQLQSSFGTVKLQISLEKLSIKTSSKFWSFWNFWRWPLLALVVIERRSKGNCGQRNLSFY